MYSMTIRLKYSLLCILLPFFSAEAQGAFAMPSAALAAEHRGVNDSTECLSWPVSPVSFSPSPGRVVEKEWLYGVGYLNVLDTYLSPLEYTGPAISVTRRSERMARWGKGKVTVQSLFTGHAGYLQMPADDGKEWDGQFTAAVAWHRNWKPADGLRLAIGGLAELGGGFTYANKGGNNPAQGRLGADVALSALAEYAFRLRRTPL